MDLTPKSEDSTHIPSPFDTSDTSSRVYESTPKTETEITPRFNNNPKKRKVQCCDIRSRKLEDVLEICSSTPQASSTLNESLTDEFGNIKIEQNYFTINGCDGPAPKYLKTNGCDKLVTPPSTPESHLKTFECTPKKASSFQKCSSGCSVASPLKEQRDILYPTLKRLEPLRKPLTPQKFKEKLEKIGQISTPLKKYVFPSITNGKRGFNKILSNDVIMEQIFRYLSDGDLFRFSMVSTDFNYALKKNTKANKRYSNYKEGHKKNKENYKITPPSSPESQNLFPEGSVSPNSQNFAEFVETGTNLKANQTLSKCPKCLKPSVVDKSIAQCQEVHTCGYIYCQKCDSFAYNPNEFYDKCQELVLSSSIAKRRPKLEDLTNCFPDFNISSILSSTTENHHYSSSGYFSGYDTSHTPLSVKRNLSISFYSNESASKPQRALYDSNRSLNTSSILSGKQEDRRRSSGNVLAVIKSETRTKKIEIIEPSSPPKVESCSVGSKESRRNLKRLTR